MSALSLPERLGQTVQGNSPRPFSDRDSRSLLAVNRRRRCRYHFPQSKGMDKGQITQLVWAGEGTRGCQQCHHQFNS